MRTDTPPANLLDLLDRWFTMLGTSLTAVRNFCIVLVALAVAGGALYLVAAAVTGNSLPIPALWCVGGTGTAGGLLLMGRLIKRHLAGRKSEGRPGGQQSGPDPGVVS